MALLEWLANNYKSFGAALEIVTDRSQEGAQFVRGFGGIGGMLFCLSGANCFLFLSSYLIYRPFAVPSGFSTVGS